MRVIIRGTIYETVREAADALGVSTSHIYNAVLKGTQDYIGIGMGRWRKPRDSFTGNKIVLHGVDFPSMKAASLALGFGQHYVRSVLLRQSPRGLRRIQEAVALYEINRR